MKKMLKKVIAVVCGMLLIVGMLTTGSSTIVFAEDTESQIEANESLVSFPSPSVAEIVDESEYDVEAIYEAGLETIAYFAENSSSCAYWADSEVIDFKLLHSFDTGRVAYALFEILGSNGQHGYMINNLEDNFPQQYGDGTSPFAKFEQAVEADEITQLSSELLSAEHYYFYQGMSYGYGVIGDDGLMDIYNIAYYLSDFYSGSEILSDVSFQNTTTLTNVQRVRQVMGDEDVKAYAEARRETAEEIAKEKINAASNVLENDNIAESGTLNVLYPEEYIISGVPDYQQSTINNYQILCIPTSMSNILAYWDMNGFPDLVPSVNDSNREAYIKLTIYLLLRQQEDGSGSNASIDPAFAEYVEEHSDYMYYGYGIYYPDYSDLCAEIYSYENPCLIGFPEIYGAPHQTTGVGYENITYQYVLVHDNNLYTEVNVKHRWDDVDFLFSFEISEPW